MYLVVIQSVISAGVGTRLRWQKLIRTGGLEVPAAVSVGTRTEDGTP